MTPLIDLTFLLLITFIITFPLVEQGVPVNLPVGRANTLDLKQAKTMISLNGRGELFLNDARVTLDEFRGAMQELARTDPTQAILVRADKDIPYGRVMEILRVLHDAHLAKLALVTREE